ncbi:MAG TPA: choice-of-anchor Q domain-containing protein [Thermoanaerobaculia bacterium]|nr:choice-of-anchor Q domain-containing protein [Thermoanaerobaculia bacterium]
MIRRSFRVFLAAAVLPLMMAAAAPPAQAAVFIPTKLTDSADGACDSDCSLREAVLAANAAAGSDFIVLGVGTYDLTLFGASEDLGLSGDLDVRDDLAIVGESASSTVIDANQLDRIFDVLAGFRLELVGLTVTNGLVVSEKGGGLRVAGELSLRRGIVCDNRAGNGGGIAGVGSNSVLDLDQSTVLENRSTSQGGGIHFENTLQLVNSTVALNVAELNGGGGIYATDDAVGTVSNSTIAFNTALSGTGGGVLVASVPFISADHPVFSNSILAANSAPSERDCSGAALSAGHNLLGDGSGCLDFGNHPGDLEGTAATPLNPQLLALNAAGGPTPAYQPAAGSPAIDHGSGCEPVDQRGAARPPACDIGSVEVTGECISGGPILCLNQSRFQVKVVWDTGSEIGSGQGVKLTDESGFFTFFDPSNVELTVKILNACNLGGKYWVFMSGLTNVGVTVTVTDTQTGQVKTYNNPRNRTFVPVLDTSAFATCP